MSKNKKEKISNEEKTKSKILKNPNCEEYGYDFVAELAHFTNIDEQRKKAKELGKKI